MQAPHVRNESTKSLQSLGIRDLVFACRILKYFQTATRLSILNEGIGYEVAPRDDSTIVMRQVKSGEEHSLAA
jgi:hypothetical protein